MIKRAVKKMAKATTIGQLYFSMNNVYRCCMFSNMIFGNNKGILMSCFSSLLCLQKYLLFGKVYGENCFSVHSNIVFLLQHIIFSQHEHFRRFICKIIGWCFIWQGHCNMLLLWLVCALKQTYQERLLKYSSLPSNTTVVQNLTLIITVKQSLI